MAHPRKKRRTQAPGKTQNAIAQGVNKANPAERTPKSMVIRMGASDVGPSVTQLVKDMRHVMEPHTASRLKERRSNRLRDYATMAGPLGVSHLLLFSRSSSGNTNLRVAVTPRGPTLNFRVEKYSLCKDVVKSQRQPKSGQGNIDHLAPPLLVMNNFSTQSPSSAADTNGSPIPKHLESLATSVFQSLFPPISPQKTPLTSIRRVLLLDRITPQKPSSSSNGRYILHLRHYAVTSKPIVSLSRGLRKLRTIERHNHHSAPPATSNGTSKKPATTGNLPNLGRLNDVADYLLDPGFTSASESEVETDAEVEVLEPDTKRVYTARERAEQKARQREAAEREGDGAAAASTVDEERRAKGSGSRRAAPVQKRAIKLTEIGPRMTLRLVKVEEGLCDGRVMWHEHVVKTAEEEDRMDVMWDQRKKEKEERRAKQKEDVERKRKEKSGNKETSGKGGEEGEDDEEDDEAEWDDYDYDMDDPEGEDGGEDAEEGAEENEEEVEGADDDEMDED